MPDGGKISIDCEVENKYLIIHFIDSGTGIDDKNIDHIFNAFFSTKNVGQGTGLGLYIVYNEIKKIGGEVQVVSEIGQGTIFKMKFPMTEEMCVDV